MKPLTYYCDTHAVQVFQTFAGESLENLTMHDAWDIVTVLSQSACKASLNGESMIETIDMVDDLNLIVSEEAEECIKALNGFPLNQVNQLMLGIVAVGFGG